MPNTVATKTLVECVAFLLIKGNKDKIDTATIIDCLNLFFINLFCHSPVRGWRGLFPSQVHLLTLLQVKLHLLTPCPQPRPFLVATPPMTSLSHYRHFLATKMTLLLTLLLLLIALLCSYITPTHYRHYPHYRLSFLFTVSPLPICFYARMVCCAAESCRPLSLQVAASLLLLSLELVFYFCLAVKPSEF